MYPRKTKILIVDDMNMFRIMVRQALQALDFSNLHEASDGSFAWKALEDAVAANEPFEFVVCDWNMPKMKGIEVLKAVRAKEWGKKLPFLMLTAESEKKNVIEALSHGVDGYIIKPFTVNTLGGNMRQIYDKKTPKAS